MHVIFTHPRSLKFVQNIKKDYSAITEKYPKMLFSGHKTTISGEIESFFSKIAKMRFLVLQLLPSSKFSKIIVNWLLSHEFRGNNRQRRRDKDGFLGSCRLKAVVQKKRESEIKMKKKKQQTK